MKRFKSTRQLQRFVSIDNPVANLFHFPRHSLSSSDHRDLRRPAMATWQPRSKGYGRQPGSLCQSLQPFAQHRLRCLAQGRAEPLGVLTQFAGIDFDRRQFCGVAD